MPQIAILASVFSTADKTHFNKKSSIVKPSSINSEPPSASVRLLVGITSFGDKNIGLLKHVINTYEAMPLKVDVVVFSNAPKDLGPTVKVEIGLPSKDPWSLPFAHKAYFTTHSKEYDIFIYTEDDIIVTFENIQAFLKITPALAENEIAGFIRYEVGPDGNRSMPEIHAGFHWKADSVKMRATYGVAEHTNEHAGFYLLTQGQLVKAIESGGFLRAPYTDQYDLACTAATDPYLRCGFTRVVCFSELEAFLIHHASNRYVGEMGITYSEFQREIDALKKLAAGSWPNVTLCETETKIYNRRWSKSCYEKPTAQIVDRVPDSAKEILSFGSGWGATEIALRNKCANLTLIPIDAVMGYLAESLDFTVISGTLSDWLQNVGTRRFDCVVMTNLIHLVSDQDRLIRQLCSVLKSGGTLLMSGPNLYALPICVGRMRDRSRFRDLADFERSGIRLRTVRALAGQVKSAGLNILAIHWYSAPPSKKNSFWRRQFRSEFSSHWIIQARRP